MDGAALEFELADEAATRRFGADLALIVRPGDLIGLSGDLGAGKSTLARALIRAIADDPELDVPSPTFTLVQNYDLRVPVAHFDLYRLSDPHELDELGLDEALAHGAALVEWPEKAGPLLPPDRIDIALTHENEGRIVRIAAPGAAMARIERTLAIRGFLEDAGHPDAERRHLLGDASTRAYETVRTTDGELILMNAPAHPQGLPVKDGKRYAEIAHIAEDVLPFVAVGRWLKDQGFAAPEIIAADLDAGILLLEHLGSGGFLSAQGEPVGERYEAAIALLADLHRGPLPPAAIAVDSRSYAIPPFDRDAMLIEVGLLLDWYLPYRRGSPATEDERQAFETLWNAMIDRLQNAEKALVLRDLHSPNIIWRGDKAGRDRLGIVDFQDAMIGPAAYDVAALTQDARVTIASDMAEKLLRTYIDLRAGEAGFDADGFREAHAIMAAQRSSKILGIFVRLDRRDHKPAYLKHLPRIEAYVAAALDHEALKPLREWYGRMGLLPAGK